MRLTSPEDFHEMMECCMLILLIAFAQKYKDNMELELIRRSFFRKMDMLKYGVLEHKEN